MQKDRFVQYFVEQRTLLYALIHALVRDPHAAEDIFQETSLVLFREADRFQEGTDFGAWARSIARNRAREHFKKRRQTVPLSEAAENAVVLAHQEIKAEWWRLRREALTRCLEPLGAEIRKVFELYYGESLTTDRIARLLGRSGTAIRLTLCRTRKKLAECAQRRMGLQP